MMDDELEEIDVCDFNWGPGDKPGPTDHTWIKLVYQTSGDLRLIQHDAGPETLSTTDSYDYAYWIDIPADNARLFTARLLNMVFDQLFEEPNRVPNFEEFQAALVDWGIEFATGDGPYDESLKRIGTP